MGHMVVEAAKLRAVLDDLREALGSSTPVSPQAPPEAGAVLATLREILAKTPKGTWRPAERFDALKEGVVRDSVQGVADAVAARVLRVLGERKVQVLRELLQTPAPDFLSVLGRTNSENAHSDVLRWLLTPRHAPNIAPAALHALARRFKEPLLWEAKIREAIAADAVVVRREHSLGTAVESGNVTDEDGVLRRRRINRADRRRMDLLVSGPGFLIAIENKLWSLESVEQTTGYWEWLAHRAGLRAGVFLSPTGQQAQAIEFNAISYLDLLVLLLEGAIATTLGDGERAVLASYVRSLEASALRSELGLVRGETRG